MDSKKYSKQFIKQFGIDISMAIIEKDINYEKNKH